MADKLCMGCMETYNDKYDVCPHCGCLLYTSDAADD